MRGLIYAWAIIALCNLGLAVRGNLEASRARVSRDEALHHVRRLSAALSSVQQQLSRMQTDQQFERVMRASVPAVPADQPRIEPTRVVPLFGRDSQVYAGGGAER